MIDLAKLVAGGLFLGILALSSGDPVPAPKSEWSDDVGKSIDSHARRSLTRYNNALRDCNNTLSTVKTETECKALEVNFDSKCNELNWQAQQINQIDINYTVEKINRILRK